MLTLDQLYHKAFMLIILLVISTGCGIADEDLSSNPVGGEGTSLSDQVAIKIDEGFRRAKTFKGFQHKKYTASISYQRENLSTNDFLETVRDEYLEPRESKLIALHDVKDSGGSTIGKLSIVKDNRKNLYRYAYALDTFDQLFIVKAIVSHDDYKTMNKKLLSVLLSAKIVGDGGEESTFKMVEIGVDKSIIYALNGDKDNGFIQVSNIGELSSLNESITSEEYLNKRLSDFIIDGRCRITLPERLSNGEIYKCSGKTKLDSTFYLSLSRTRNPDVNTLILAKGKNLSIRDVDIFVRDDILDLKLEYIR